MKKIIPFVVGLIMLGGVLYYVGVENIVTVLSKTNLFYFLLALVCYLIVQILAAMKLKIVSRLKFSQIFLSHQGGMLLSQITPGKAGYLYTAYSIAKKEKKSISSMIGVISLIQGIMMAVKILLISVALIYFSFYFQIPNYLFLSVLIPILMLLAIVFLLYSKSSKKLLSKILFLKKGVKYLESMQKAVKIVTKKTALRMVVLDLMGWFFCGLQFFFLVNALEINLSFLICLMLNPLISVIMFVPISPTALGVAESGSALIFDLLGLQLGTGVAFLLLFRINSIAFDSVGLIDLKTIKIPRKLKI